MKFQIYFEFFSDEVMKSQHAGELAAAPWHYILERNVPSMATITSLSISIVS